MSINIGTVKELQGDYFAKEPSGNVVKLSIGDIITEDMIVYGNESNPSSAMIQISMIDTAQIFTITGTQEQKFDISLVEEESFEDKLSPKILNEALLAEIYSEDSQEEDSDEELLEETEAGEENVVGQSVDDVFLARNDSSVDISSDIYSGTLAGTTGDLLNEEWTYPFAGLTTPTLSVGTPNTFTEDAISNVVGATVVEFTTRDEDGDTVTVIIDDTTHYAIEDGKVVLTQEGVDLVNAGEDLPEFTLTPNDGTQDGEPVTVTPPKTIDANDAATIVIDDASVVTFTEDAGAIAGSKVADYTAADQDGTTPTVTVSNSGTTQYYAIENDTVVLTQAGADLVNRGADLPTFTVSATDGIQTTPATDSATPPPTINVDDAGSVTIVGDAEQGQTLTTTLVDPDGITGTPVYTWSVGGVEVTNPNTDQSTFTLTQNEVGEEISVSVSYEDAFGTHIVSDSIDGTDNGGEIVGDVNDSATIIINDSSLVTFTQGSADKGDKVADYTAADEDGTKPTVTISNANGGDTPYYAIENDTVVLTQAGADLVNRGEDLPTFTVSATDGIQTTPARDSATPATTIALPVITNITDDSNDSDYSDVTLHGTGEPGATITLFSKDGTTTGANNTNSNGFIAILPTQVIHVDANGNWSADISNLDNTPINDNEFFYAEQTVTDVSNSATSNTVHYWHGTWNSVNTEVEDDYVFGGEGSDVFTAGVNDDNDRLVIDGGADSDRVIIPVAHDEVTIDKVADNLVIVTEANGDVNELRDVEFISFADGMYDVVNENFFPITNDDTSLTAVEDTETTYAANDLIGNDTDFDGDTLTITAVGNAVNGTVKLNDDGTVTFTPAPNYNGNEAKFEYTVSDGNGGSDTGTATVNVSAVNDRPVITIDSVTTFTEDAESNAVGSTVATFTTSDAEGDAVTVSISNANGGDTPYYALGTGDDEGIVVLTQEGVDLINSGEDLPAFILTPNDGTANGDAVTVTPPETIDVDDAPIFDNPNDDTDGDGSEDGYAFTYAENATTATVLGTVAASDADGDGVTYSITSGNDNGWFTINTDGEITLTDAGVAEAANDFESTPNVHNLTVTATAGGVATDIAVKLSESNVNDNTPEFDNPNDDTDGDGSEDGYAFTYAENATTATVLGTVAASDADGDGVTYSITSGNDNGWFTINTDGEITLTDAGVAEAANDFESTPNVHNLTVTATAGGVATDIAVVMSEENENENPIAVDDYKMNGLRAEYYGYEQGPDGANLTNVEQIREFISTKTPDATFTPTSLDYALGSGDLGRDENLQNFLGSDASSLSADPQNTSDAIISMNGFITLDAGTYNFKVTADDGYTILIDGQDVATVNNIQSPTGRVHESFEVTTSGEHSIEIIYWDQGGQYQFKAELSNDDGTTYSTLNVESGTQALSTSEDTALVITPQTMLANDVDLDGDTLSITSVSNPSNGTVLIDANGNVVFTPTENYHGDASFEYTISDGNGGSDTATVYLEVISKYDAPVAMDDAGSVNESGLDAGTTSGDGSNVTSGNLFKNDTYENGSNITITEVFGQDVSGLNGIQTIATKYGSLEIDLASGEYTYTLTTSTTDITDVLEMDNIAYTIQNTEGVSSSAELKITINDDTPKALSSQDINLVIEPINTNVVFILDVSGSMSDSELRLQEEARDAVISKYTNLGDVNVMQVQFENNVHENTGWKEASKIQGTSLYKKGGSTNYEAAVNSVMDTYNNSRPEADQTIVYFLSDGASNRGSDTDWNTEWETFIKQDSITKLFTFGVGGMQNDLYRVALSGEDTKSPDPVAINNINDLPTELANTALQYVEGNLTADINGTSILDFGADGGHIQSIKIGSESATYDADNLVQTISSYNDANQVVGNFEINFKTGEYTYIPILNEDHNIELEASIVDSDGDELDAILVDVNIEHAVEHSYDSSTAIDGGDGYDVLTLNSELSLDFSDTNMASIVNIEKIDLTVNGNHTLSNLSLDGILSLTDTDNTLEITGDLADSVETVDQTGWTKNESHVDSDTTDGMNEYVYDSKTTSDSITLKVDEQIDNTGL